MNALITKSRTRNNNVGRSIVYVESPLNDIADKFASEHGIYHLQFKSKTWTKICREVSKATALTLEKLFPHAESIKFSAKAGCKCGCSPGYVVKHNEINTDHWVNITATEDEKETFSQMMNAKRFTSALHQEIEYHNSTTTNILK